MSAHHCPTPPPIHISTTTPQVKKLKGVPVDLDKMVAFAQQLAPENLIGQASESSQRLIKAFDGYKRESLCNLGINDCFVVPLREAVCVLATTVHTT